MAGFARMVEGNLRKIWWNQDRHLLDVTARILQNHLVQNLFIKGTTGEAQCMNPFSQRPKIMRFASVRKLQGQLADIIHKVTHSARQSSVISLPPTTRSSVQKENRGAIKGMHLLCKIWPLNGFQVTHAKRKLHKKRREICGSFSILEKNRRATYADNLLAFRNACEDLQWPPLRKLQQ